MLSALSTDIDALALHLYGQAPLAPDHKVGPIWASHEIQEAQHALISDPAGVALLLAQPGYLWQHTIDTPGWQGVGRELWITEWNLTDWGGAIRHNWAHGLYVAQALNTFLGDERVTQILLHNIGDAMFGAFFLPPTPLYFDGLDLDAVDEQTLIARIPPYGLTASGRVLSTFARAMDGADRAVQLMFTPTPTVVIDDGQTFQYSYPAVWGWAFIERATGLTRLILANVWSESMTVTLESLALPVSPLGKVFIQISAPPNSYPVTAEDIAFTGGLITTALTLPPYSLTWAELAHAITTEDDTADLVPGDGTCRDASGACSLRAAVQEANATPGLDVIKLPAGTYALTLAGPNEDLALTGDLDLLSDTAIYGAGPDATIIDATGIDRAFDVLAGTTRLWGVTVRGGQTDVGGGLRVAGALALHRSRVISNTASSAGGGLAVAQGGSAILSRVELSGNQAPSGGGLFSQGTVTITQSAIVDNEAQGRGGGLHVAAGSADVGHSTIGRNTSSTSGGGLAVTGEAHLSLRGATVAENMAGIAGGGIAAVGAEASATMTGSIVLGNDAPLGADCGMLQSGAIASGAGNVLGLGSGCQPVAGDRLALPRDAFDQVMTPLTTTWGLPIYGLRPGSLAIDVRPCQEAADQRGQPREPDACDAGALEWQRPSIALRQWASSETVYPAQAVTYTLQVVNLSPDADASAWTLLHTTPAILQDIATSTSGIDARPVLAQPPTWIVDRLQPLATGTITITGHVPSELADEATWLVTAIASQEGQVLATDTLTTTANLPPLADAGGPYQALEGTPFLLDATASHDPGGIRFALWDLDGDGFHDDAQGITATVALSNEGAYTVGLRAIDARGAWDVDEALVTVANAPPSLVIYLPGMTWVGRPFTVTGEIHDPGVLDPHTVTIGWGDETTSTISLPAGMLSFEASHVYTKTGTLAMHFSVSDDVEAGEPLATWLWVARPTFLPQVSR
ncbi:MAG: hypothetical protein Kow0047_33850 [Anaerolineae bacterium]